MARDWQELTKMTGNSPIVVEKVRLIEKDIAIEGSFELPPLARMTMEDQIFAAAFIQSHGSIKEMERLFGVSYPTIRLRLDRLITKIGVFEQRGNESQLERLIRAKYVDGRMDFETFKSILQAYSAETSGPT